MFIHFPVKLDLIFDKKQEQITSLARSLPPFYYLAITWNNLIAGLLWGSCLHPIPMRVWCLLPTSWEVYFSRIELDPTKFIPAWYSSMYSFNKTRLFDWLKIRENNENQKFWTYIISQVYFKELKREYLGNDLIQKLDLESGCHKFGPQVFWRW